MGKIVVIDAVRTKETEARVRSCVNAGNCIGCNDTPPRQHKKRGLCDRCHGRWTRERDGISDDTERAEFDAKLISLGLLLHEHEISRMTSVGNVFADVRNSLQKA